jgi:ribonuclease BN (tRNA processing enzyme)
VLIYVPDAGYEAEALPAGLEAHYRDADCLIHDCTYTPRDRRARLSRGYSSIDIAATVAARCEVKRLVMFHYDQDYTDEQIDHLWTECRRLLDRQPGGGQVELIAAEEGLTLAI